MVWPIHQSQGDYTPFINHSATGEVIALLVYVDDIIVTSYCQELGLIATSLMKELKGRGNREKVRREMKGEERN